MDCPGQDQAGHGQDAQAYAPGDSGPDVTRDQHAQSGAEEFAGQDHAIDTAALLGRKKVARQGRHGRTGAGGDGPERQPGQQEHRERRREATNQLCGAPEQNSNGKDPGPVRAIGEDPDRYGGQRAHQDGNGHQQADSGVANSKRRLELRSERTDGADVRAAQRQNRGQQTDGLTPGPAANGCTQAVEAALQVVLQAVGALAHLTVGSDAHPRRPGRGKYLGPPVPSLRLDFSLHPSRLPSRLDRKTGCFGSTSYLNPTTSSSSVDQRAWM